MHQIAWFWTPKLKTLPTVGGGTPPSHTLPPGSVRFAPSPSLYNYFQCFSLTLIFMPGAIHFCLFSRHCGRVLCSKCSSKMVPIVKYDLVPPRQSVRRLLRCLVARCYVGLEPWMYRLSPQKITSALSALITFKIVNYLEYASGI